MKTSVIEVHDMLSVLSVDEVEKRIGEVPGVESVTVNFAAGSATVRYDETRLEIADIKSAVRQRGYESAAPATPAPATAKTAPVAHATAGAAQQDKKAPDAAPSAPVAVTPKPAPAASAPAAVPAAPAGNGHEGHAAPEKN